MNIKFFIKYPKEGQKNKIHIRVRVGRAVDLSLVTKETCYLEDWDASNGLLATRYYEYRNGRKVELRDITTKNKIAENEQTNSRLRVTKELVENAYKIGTNKIDSLWLSELLYPTITEEKFANQELLEYCDVFLQAKGSTISTDYITKINSIKEIIIKYTKSRNLKSLQLTDINLNFKNDFEKFYLNEESYSINYFERNFKFIKTILYHAQSFGYEIYSGLSSIRCKTEKTLFQILTPTEQELISNARFSEEHLETAKDWLLISCMTAQRVSDFMRFRTDMISEKKLNGKNRMFIEFTQTKTNKQVVIPLDSRIIDILKKRNWNFPRKMSETRYNEHIKKVCEYVGISEVVEGSLSLNHGDKVVGDKIVRSTRKDKRKPRKIKGFYPKHLLVSSHIGRRSFATNNYGIIPTPYLLVMTGHETPQMLMKYIGKVEEQHALALSNFIK